ncbi:MAG: MFS transporter [Patescibacteria group bacterium]
MSRLQRLKRNPRLLFWGKALTELKTLNAIVVLFYLHRGVTFEQVFYLTLAWSVVTLIFEVPSGYLADKIGRKKTLLLGSFILAGAFSIMWFAHGFWMFILVQSLISLSYSMFSGTEEALLYDSLKELKEESKLTQYFGRLQSAKNIFKIFVPAIGAFIAKDLLESQFQILIGIEIMAIILSFIVLLFLAEPKHERSVEDYEKGIFSDSLDLIKSQPMLLRVAMNRTLFFIASVLVWRAYQPMFVDFGFTAIWFGVFYVLMQASVFLISWFSEELKGWLGLRFIFVEAGWGAMLAIVVAAFSGNRWLVFFAILTSIIMENMRYAHFSDIFNCRLKSWNRATALSNLNVLKGILDIPILIFAGYLAVRGAQWVVVFAAFLCLLALVIFPIKRKDYK